MSLTPGQGRVAFVLIVLAFAGLGTFLLLPHIAGDRASRPPARPATGASASSAPVANPAVSAPRPSAAGQVRPSAQATPQVDIYRLLPFSQGGLDRAVVVAQRFAADYGTYSYRQDAAEYVATMRGLVTASLAATLARGYATPGVARMRSQQKQASTGSATVTGLRAFGPTSLTFVVKVVQRIAAVQGTSELTGDFAVTLTSAGGNWRVNDIEIASAGNS